MQQNDLSKKNANSTFSSDDESGYEFYEDSQSGVSDDATDLDEKNNDCVIDIPDDDYVFYSESPSLDHAIPVQNNDCVIDIPEDLTVSSSFNTAHHAFNALLMESVLTTLSKDHTPAMTYMQAIRDGFYDNNALSFKKAGIAAVSLIVGSTAAFFYAIPARKAAEIIAEAFASSTGTALPGADILGYVLMVAATGYNVGVSGISTLHMIENYFGHVSPAEKFLTFHQATFREKIETIGRDIFDASCAMAGAVPNYVLIAGESVPMAVLTALANITLNWKGMSQLKIGPDTMPAACKAEKYYLRDQINTFIKLPFDVQNKILDEIDALNNSGNHDELHFKKIYARLLNLASTPSHSPGSSLTQIQDIHYKSTKQTFVPKLVGAAGLVSEGAVFASATGVGIAGFFPNPASPQAIIAALPAALLALIQAIGLGYKGGVEAGKFLTTDEVELSHLFQPKVHTALKWLIYAGSVLSGGATFSTGCMIGDKFADAANVTQPLADILKYTVSGIGHAGISTLNAYYVTRLLDEVLLYFAVRCGDEKVKRLFTFVLGMRKIQDIFTDMTDVNYFNLLRWKMSACDELAELLTGIFSSRLSDKQYQQLSAQVNVDGVLLKDKAGDVKFDLVPCFIESESSKLINRKNRAKKYDLLFFTKRFQGVNVFSDRNDDSEDTFVNRQ